MKRANRVLVAEDSPLQADLLKSILSGLGISDITRVDNGRDAVRQFEQGLDSEKPYGVVFLDIVMPEMNGQEALRGIRALEKERGIPAGEKVVIIMTTVCKTVTDMMDALLEGDCNDYIVKPVEGEYLKPMLAKYNIID